MIDNGNSDHKCIHFCKISEWNHQTPARWKLNDQILKNEEEVRSFLENGSEYRSWGSNVDEYDLFKSKIQDGNKAKNEKLLADQKLIKQGLEFQISKIEKKLTKIFSESEAEKLESK